MKNRIVFKIVLTAMFFALGLVLPFLTGQIPEIGSMLLPMHLPVFLCALICGWQYAGMIGVALPLIRSLLFTMPPMFPTAVAMAFELCAYGIITGIVYALFKHKSILTVYIALLSGMIGGRTVWGVVQFLLLSSSGKEFTFAAFLAGAFVNALPGIIVQLILIPVIMLALDKAKLVPFNSHN
ncbi:MAG: ECF transporter S component [Clostridia bacterium]|nr:ECF transporter S component [Clostridia bacterium]